MVTDIRIDVTGDLDECSVMVFPSIFYTIWKTDTDRGEALV